MNGYSFSEEVRHALAQSREEAVHLRHPYVGTEHILLGLISSPSSVATAILAACQVDPPAVRNRVEGAVVPGSHEVGPDLPYTSRAKKVLELAMTQARDLGHDHVGTGHVLIGCIREHKGIAARALADNGLSLDAAVRALDELAAPGRRKASPRNNELRVMTGREAGMMLHAMAASVDVAAVFRKHGVDVQALIKDLLQLESGTQDEKAD